MTKLPITEGLFLETLPIDKLNDEEALNLMINEQINAGLCIKKILPEINKVVVAIYERIKCSKYGRIIYSGAGTSGRIGVQDGAELYPTFGWPKERFKFVIAGSKEALVNSVENAEDDIIDAKKQVKNININKFDVVIGLAASGNTPFTCRVLELAKQKGALTVAISNNPDGNLLNFGIHKVVMNTQQEVIAGSTRLKAGTSQKICLNLISSLVMVKLGYIKNGYMINLIPNNKKLRDRKLMINNDEAKKNSK